MTQPIDLLHLWIKKPEENDDDYTFWIGPEKPSEDAVLLTRENVETWLNEDPPGEDGPWASKMTITLHDDVDQARKAAIAAEGGREIITSFGRLASGRGATLIQDTSESFDGYIRLERDGMEVSHRDPTRISYELTQAEIDAYQSTAIKEQLRERNVDRLFAMIVEAARNDPKLIEDLQQRIERGIPGAAIGINTGELQRVSGYEQLSFDQQIMLQVHMHEKFGGCEDASPENLESFADEAQTKISDLLAAKPATP